MGIRTCKKGAVALAVVVLAFFKASPSDFAFAQSADVDDATFHSIDIMDLHLGMTAEAARALIKARQWKDYYEESSTTLSFLDSTKSGLQSEQIVAVPDGKFLNEMLGYSRTLEGDEANIDQLGVFFSPLPGHERVVGVFHSVRYAHAHQVLVSEFTKALLDKYGQDYWPRNQVPRQQYRWIHTAQPIRDDVTAGQCVPMGLDKSLRGGNGRVNSKNPVLASTPANLIAVAAKCGSVIVDVAFFVVNPRDPLAQQVISGYEISMTSPSLALESAREAARLIKTASDAFFQQKANQASQNKPVL
jgi:hypothetical protein